VIDFGVPPERAGAGDGFPQETLAGAVADSGRSNDLPEADVGCGRTLLCIILPPLAVMDKGCGSVVLVVLLTLAGWVPGVIGALVINNRGK
jgi:uncharacterized membrane protein YqaE (UPF0057 family)